MTLLHAQDLIDGLDDGLLRNKPHGTARLTLHRAEDERRDALDAKLLGNLTLLVNINLINIDFSIVFLRYVVKERSQTLARTAPRGGEINDARQRAFEFPFGRSIVVKDLVTELFRSKWRYNHSSFIIFVRGGILLDRRNGLTAIRT